MLATAKYDPFQYTHRMQFLTVSVCVVQAVHDNQNNDYSCNQKFCILNRSLPLMRDYRRSIYSWPSQGFERFRGRKIYYSLVLTRYFRVISCICNNDK